MLKFDQMRFILDVHLTFFDLEHVRPSKWNPLNLLLSLLLELVTLTGTEHRNQVERVEHVRRLRWSN